LSAIARTIESPYGWLNRYNNTSAIAGTIEVPYGWLKWMIVSGLCLIFIITILLCRANYIKLDNDFDYNDTGNEVTVRDITASEITVTATPDYK